MGLINRGRITTAPGVWDVSLTASPAVGTGAPVTFSAASIGAADSDRYVVVCAITEDGTNTTTRPITSMTIGGVTATEAAQASGDAYRRNAAVFYLKVTSGTTADIVLNFASGHDGALIRVYRVIVPSGTTMSVKGSLTDITHTSGVVLDASDLTVDEGAAAFIAVMQDTTNTATFTTSSGLTEDFEGELSGGDTSGAIYSGTTTAGTLDVDTTSSDTTSGREMAAAAVAFQAS